MKQIQTKKILFFILVAFSLAFIKTNNGKSLVPPKDSTIFNCNLDMRPAIFSIDSSMNIIYGKSNPLFKDVAYFADCNGFINTFCTSDSASLFYNVYYPKNHNYDSCPLPPVILFHAGSFSDCKPLDASTEQNKICRELAKRGFVVYAIGYRTGVLIDILDRKYSSAQQVLAVYRAVQDGRGAIRSIIKRQRNYKKFADPYRIDTNNIFLAGASAGSFVSLNLAYYQTQTMIDSVSPGVKAVLGSINADYYYGDSTIQYNKKIKGVMNMWGNVYLPLSAMPDPSSFFAKNINNPPLISFHGLLDTIAPFGITDTYFAPNTIFHSTFNSETHCLVYGTKYKLYPKIKSPDMYASGSDNIYNFLKKKGIPTELYLDCQMGHGLDDAGPDFQSEFGTGISNPDSVNVYMVQRTCTFFQAVVNDIAKNLTTTRFTECENKRFGCSGKNNNNGCNNKDSCTPVCSFAHYSITSR